MNKIYTIYFALNSKQSEANEIQQALNIANRYFVSCTLHNTFGIWQGKIERSYKIEILTSQEDSPIIEQSIKQFSDFIKHEYNQTSVLYTRFTIHSELI